MKRIGTRVAAMILLAAGLALPALAATATMTSIEHRQAMQRAESDYKAALANCSALSADAKKMCEAEAKAAEKRAKAQIDAAYRNTDTQRDTRIEDAKADRIVAGAKCDSLSGDAKDACRKEAKAAEEQAVAGARNDAAQAKLDADYDAEAARCATLAAPANESCLANAKAKYGK